MVLYPGSDGGWTSGKSKENNKSRLAEGCFPVEYTLNDRVASGAFLQIKI